MQPDLSRLYTLDKQLRQIQRVAVSGCGKHKQHEQKTKKHNTHNMTTLTVLM